MALSSFLRLLLTVTVPLRPQSKPPAKAGRKDGGSFSAQCFHLLSDVLFIKQSRFCLEGFQSDFSSHVTQTDLFIDPTHWPQDLWSWISWRRVHLGGPLWLLCTRHHRQQAGWLTPLGPLASVQAAVEAAPFSACLWESSLREAEEGLVPSLA